MSHDKLIPRGLPLTDYVDLVDPQGVCWVTYVEGFPPPRQHRFLNQTVLPGRRLRFDSATESRLSPRVPAGSPFLTERRLLLLLAESPLLQPAVPARSEPRAVRWSRHLGAAAGRIHAIGQRLDRTIAYTGHSVHLALEHLLFGRRVRP